jgi:hypothetical protein
MKSFPLEELRQLLLQDDEPFHQRFDHPWLVWEAGSALAGNPFERTLAPEDIDLADPERSIAELESARPRGDDDSEGSPCGRVMCFALDDSPGPQFIRVGRAEDNDVVVNDLTVSREHLVLTRDLEGVWRVESITGGITFCKEPLPPSAPRPINRGDQVKLGKVTLTFYDPAGMVERLRD